MSTHELARRLSSTMAAFVLLGGLADATICYTQSLTLRRVEGIVVADDELWWVPNSVIPGADVELTAGSYQATAVTDIDGYFRFSQVRQGNYQIRARLAGYGEAYGEIRVRESAPGQVLVMELTPYIGSCGYVRTESVRDARRLQRGLLLDYPKRRGAETGTVDGLEAPTYTTVWACGEDGELALEPSWEGPSLSLRPPRGGSNCRFTPASAKAWNQLVETVERGQFMADPGDSSFAESPCVEADVVAAVRALANGKWGRRFVRWGDEAAKLEITLALRNLLDVCESDYRDYRVEFSSEKRPANPAAAGRAVDLP